jgi:aryl sulfotransferase
MSATGISWPKKTRDVVNAVCDSTRWDSFRFREGDIVIASWSKAGTTWTQQIITQLIHGGRDGLTGGDDISPWLDANFTPLPAALDLLEKQKHRRLIKTHLPATALGISPRARYIYVGRDARDIIWSAHNHVTSFTEEALVLLRAKDGAIMRPLADVGAYYRDFLDGGPSAEGPAGGLFDHVRSWWDLRHLPNVFFVHFANLKADVAAETRRIARLLDIPLTDDLVARVIGHSNIDYMRIAMATGNPRIKVMFKDGANNFFNKGTNGRWKDVLSAEEIARCDEVAAKCLPPDCAHWLKTGELPD